MDGNPNPKILLAAVGFEPMPLKRLVPLTSALDRSAELPHVNIKQNSGSDNVGI